MSSLGLNVNAAGERIAHARRLWRAGDPGGAGWGHPISDNTRLTANFGSAYKAPTFNELYFPNFGNTNLRPE